MIDYRMLCGWLLAMTFNFTIWATLGWLVIKLTR
jgi:hypothetical protein